jgi:hypothetical protein
MLLSREERARLKIGAHFCGHFLASQYSRDALGRSSITRCSRFPNDPKVGTPTWRQGADVDRDQPGH